MDSALRGAAQGAVLSACFLSAAAAQAWYGPICYSDRTTQLALTIPSISGETPGDLKVDFDDNDGKVRLGSIRASTLVKNAHEITLIRDVDSQNGVFAVVVTSPRSTTGYKFELEFRKDPSECMGAIIKATDRAGGAVLAHNGAPAPTGTISQASARVRPKIARAPTPRPSASPSPTSTDVPVVNLDEGAVQEPKVQEPKVQEPKVQEAKGQEAGTVPEVQSSDQKPAVETKPAAEVNSADAKPAAAPAAAAPAQSPTEQSVSPSATITKGASEQSPTTGDGSGPGEAPGSGDGLGSGAAKQSGL